MRTWWEMNEAVPPSTPPRLPKSKSHRATEQLRMDAAVLTVSLLLGGEVIS